MLFWGEVVCGPVGPALMILGHTVRFSLRDQLRQLEESVRRTSCNLYRTFTGPRLSAMCRHRRRRFSELVFFGCRNLKLLSRTLIMS